MSVSQRSLPDPLQPVADGCFQEGKLPKEPAFARHDKWFGDVCSMKAHADEPAWVCAPTSL
jgi:hypothetical protein